MVTSATTEAHTSPKAFHIVGLYRIVLGKCPWALAAQVPKLRVGGYTEKVLELFNYAKLAAMRPN